MQVFGDLLSIGLRVDEEGVNLAGFAGGDSFNMRTSFAAGLPNSYIDRTRDQRVAREEPCPLRHGSLTTPRLDDVSEAKLDAPAVAREQRLDEVTHWKFRVLVGEVGFQKVWVARVSFPEKREHRLACQNRLPRGLDLTHLKEPETLKLRRVP